MTCAATPCGSERSLSGSGSRASRCRAGSAARTPPGLRSPCGTPPRWRRARGRPRGSRRWRAGRAAPPGCPRRRARISTPPSGRRRCPRLRGPECAPAAFASAAASRSLTTAVTRRGLPSRSSEMSTFSPMLSRPIELRRLPASLTGRPLTAVMTSPALMPAFSAAEPSTTCDTSAPCVLSGRSMLCAISGVSVWMFTPSTPRFTVAVLDRAGPSRSSSCSTGSRSRCRCCRRCAKGSRS